MTLLNNPLNNYKSLEESTDEEKSQYREYTLLLKYINDFDIEINTKLNSILEDIRIDYDKTPMKDFIK